MTNKELVAELAKRLEWTQGRTTLVLESAITLITECLVNGDSVNIQGFGAFESRIRQERISVNPITKQRFLVPPKITPAFRPGQTVKDKLKNI